MIGGIVLTHGHIGTALINAAESILGEIDNIHALSTRGLSLLDINTKLKQIVSTENWEGGTIIMASLMGGTCWNSGVGLARHLPNIEVISGVNLTMLISFLSKRDQYSLSELTEMIRKDAIRGIERLIQK